MIIGDLLIIFTRSGPQLRLSQDGWRILPLNARRINNVKLYNHFIIQTKQSLSTCLTHLLLIENLRLVPGFLDTLLLTTWITKDHLQAIGTTAPDDGKVIFIMRVLKNE